MARGNFGERTTRKGIGRYPYGLTRASRPARAKHGLQGLLQTGQVRSHTVRSCENGFGQEIKWSTFYWLSWKKNIHPLPG